MRASEASLEAKLRTAVADADAATASSSAATSAADTLRARVQALEAEKRVLNDSIRQMRQECTERWVRACTWCSCGWLVLAMYVYCSVVRELLLTACVAWHVRPVDK